MTVPIYVYFWDGLRVGPELLRIGRLRREVHALVLIHNSMRIRSSAFILMASTMAALAYSKKISPARPFVILVPKAYRAGISTAIYTV